MPPILKLRRIISFDLSYAIVKHTPPIPVDSYGRCAVTEEPDGRDEITQRPKIWNYTAECKTLTSQEVKKVFDVEALFQKTIQKPEGRFGVY